MKIKEKLKANFNLIKAMSRKEVKQMIISLVVVLIILLIMYGWIFPGVFQLHLPL